MKVTVQQINEKGRPCAAKARVAMPVYHGTLCIQEERVQALGRSVVTAHLLSDSTQAAVIPLLHDAIVLFLKDKKMRVRGFETVDGVQYGQTWDVEVP